MKRWYMELPKYAKNAKSVAGKKVAKEYKLFLQEMRKNVGSYNLIFNAIPKIYGAETVNRELAEKVRMTKNYFDGALECLKNELWEVDGRYPKQSSLYQKLADAFQCRVSYLMDDNETVCLGNDEPSEYSGAKQARQILEQTAALFASGTMTNEDKTIFMDEMTRLYLESKKNRRKW